MATLTTLRDYAVRYSLHIFCPACRHHAVLNAMQAAQVAGWYVTLPDLKAALRCSRCATKGAEVRVVHDGRPCGEGWGGVAPPRSRKHPTISPQ